jgi:Asp-tRNA(Asn)/Glu-tRNA(Gln) amidotransferase C subunit
MEASSRLLSTSLKEIKAKCELVTVSMHHVMREDRETECMHHKLATSNKPIFRCGQLHPPTALHRRNNSEKQERKGPNGRNE